MPVTETIDDYGRRVQGSSCEIAHTIGGAVTAEVYHRLAVKLGKRGTR